MGWIVCVCAFINLSLNAHKRAVNLRLSLNNTFFFLSICMCIVKSTHCFLLKITFKKISVTANVQKLQIGFFSMKQGN